MKRNFLKIALFTITLSVVSCKSASDTKKDNSERPERNEDNRRPEGNQQKGGKRGERPTIDQILAQMDTNKDGQLAQSEVKGPLKNDFSKIDTNNDGFISKDELANAPKPEKRGEHR